MPFRHNPCLHAAFEKESKTLFDWLCSNMQTAVAAAHATAHAAAYVEEFVHGLHDVMQEPEWSTFCVNAERSINDEVMLPLRDVSTCLANVTGRSVAALRSGVVRHSDSSVQPILKSAAPENGFFFGNPKGDVSSSLNLAIMDSLVARQRQAPATRGFKRPASSFSRRGGASSSATASSTSASKDSKGKASGRFSKGRGGGRK